MKTAAASVISASAAAPPIWNRMRKTSALLRKLSLNAEKNWVQNRGAKRRVINSDEDMVFPPAPKWVGARPPHPIHIMATLLCPLPASGARARAAAVSQLKRRQFGQDDNRGRRSRLNRRGKTGLQKNNTAGQGRAAPP